jgi:putative Mg2+ transporter-C (MgtC) family protein
MPFPDTEWEQLLLRVFQLILAFLITLPVALDRERRSRSMGLRTFPIVAVASAGFVLIARSIMDDNADAQARIIQGLMTGIGFIGGGAILKEEDGVAGTATAASIWATGAIGGAVAYHRYEIAFLVGLFNFAILRFLSPVKTRLKELDEDEDSDA